MSSTQPPLPKFAPEFAMPVIGPPPPSYLGTVAAYYTDVSTKTTVTATLVEILAEQLAPHTGTLMKKGLKVTIANPAASFPTPATVSALPPFGTLFALMGGEVSYVPAGDPAGLNSMLPQPFSSLSTPVKYPDPLGLIPATWGTLVLRLWGTDLKLLKNALKDAPACLFVYYVGVDEASLGPHIKAALKRIYPQQAHLDHLAADAQLPVAKQKKPPLRQIVEAIRLTAYPGGPNSSTPGYASLIDDYFAAFLTGTAPVLVKGGAPIGRAIEVNPPFGAAVGQVELWFVGAATPSEFISPAWILSGAPTYGF